MKNMLKSFTVLILSCYIILNFALPVSAEEYEKKPIYTEKLDERFETESEIFIEEDQILGTFEFVDPNLVGTSIPKLDLNGISHRWFGHSVKTKDLPIEIRTGYLKPDGQPKYGYDGGSEAIVFFFDYGGTTKSVDLSFKVGNSWFNSTLKVNNGRVSGSGSGYAAAVPEKDDTEKPWFFWFKQTHRIQPTRIDYYGNGKYLSTSISIKSLGYSLYHEWRH